MDTQILAGAYLIRNKHHFKVLHIENPQDSNPLVTLHDRDENLYRDHQIWWIEPIPGGEEEKECSITNVRNWKALEPNSEGWGRGVGAKLIAAENTGSPRQTWKISRFMDDTDG